MASRSWSGAGGLFDCLRRLMFLVVLANHLAASHLESFFATFRPAAALGHNIGQHIEGLWIRQQPVNSPIFG